MPDLVVALVLFAVVLIAVAMLKGVRRDSLSEPLDVAANLPGAVVLRVIDGDTVDVKSGWSRKRLRLDGIDCPECDQQWGDIAKYGLIKLIGGKRIRIECHSRDKYGRTLATLYVRKKGSSEWMNVNLRMVMLGHAWVSMPLFAHLPAERQQELASVQRWARSKRVGLWRSDSPVPPWQWRNGMPSQSTVVSIDSGRV